MADCSQTYYMNPLTLEANQFLQSFERLSEKNNQIDEVLCDTLESIVGAIERFLINKPGRVVKTNSVVLVDPNKFLFLERTYHCQECRRDLGKSMAKVVPHVVHHIAYPGKNVQKLEKMAKSQRKAEKRLRRAEEKEKALLKIKSVIVKSLAHESFHRNCLEISETAKRLPEYDIMEKDILNLLEPIYPDMAIKVYKFGSRISGTGTNDSDLDVYVDIGNQFYNYECRPTESTLIKMNEIYQNMRRSPDWANTKAIFNTRVPILKVYNVNSGLNCDIGLTNSLGFLNTKLMTYMFDLQPIARIMCIFLKHWRERVELKDMLISYALNLMVIFYLQANILLPAVKDLQEGLKPAVSVGPWIGNFKEKTLTELGITQVDVNLENCVMYINGFFNFYSKYKLNTFAVSPYLGRKTSIAHLEDEMPEYYKEATKSWRDNDQLRIKKVMVVQDPFELCHNVTKGMVPYLIKRFTEACEYSIQVIRQNNR